MSFDLRTSSLGIYIKGYKAHETVCVHTLTHSQTHAHMCLCTICMCIYMIGMCVCVGGMDMLWFTVVVREHLGGHFLASTLFETRCLCCSRCAHRASWP